MTRHCLAFCTLLVMLAASPATASTTPPTLHFSTFVTTDLPLGDIVWTGSQFLYNAENLGKLETSDALGRNFKTFTSFDQGGEEMRCVPAPAAPKYWPVGIYCHTPDNRVVRVSTDGSSMTQLGTLPVIGNSDGSIAFDTVGKFGYGLLVASGGSASTGGQVFELRRGGRVTAPAASWPWMHTGT